MPGRRECPRLPSLGRRCVQRLPLTCPLLPLCFQPRSYSDHTVRQVRPCSRVLVVALSGSVSAGSGINGGPGASLAEGGSAAGNFCSRRRVKVEPLEPSDYSLARTTALLATSSETADR